jgi:hypothetical protein
MWAAEAHANAGKGSGDLGSMYVHAAIMCRMPDVRSAGAAYSRGRHMQDTQGLDLVEERSRARPDVDSVEGIVFGMGGI